MAISYNATVIWAEMNRYMRHARSDATSNNRDSHGRWSAGNWCADDALCATSNTTYKRVLSSINSTYRQKGQDRPKTNGQNQQEENITKMTPSNDQVSVRVT